LGLGSRAFLIIFGEPWDQKSLRTTALESLKIVSKCPRQSQLQTVVEELFQANDFDVEGSIIYKQWVHDDHIKIVFMKSNLENSLKKSTKQ
jgi:hypothetical protein